MAFTSKVNPVTGLRRFNCLELMGRDKLVSPFREVPSSFHRKTQKFSPVGMKTSRCTIMRVLIADDQKSVGATLAHLVSECSHEVVAVVSSGLEAIQAYGRHHPDVVLMDYWMSKLNGGTACRNIVAKYPGAKIILVSGWSHLKDVDHSGAVGTLSKPVDIDQLDNALHNAISASDSQNENVRQVEHLGVVGGFDHTDDSEPVFFAAAF